MSNKDKIVKVHYKGTFDDGSQFDCSYDRGEPLEFTCGAGMMIPGFDAAVETMELGEKKTVRLEPSEAYGEKREDLILTFPVTDIPEGEDFKVGDQIALMGPGGTPVLANVVELNEENIVIDANHQLAGEPLTFEIELVEVQ